MNEAYDTVTVEELSGIMYFLAENMENLVNLFADPEQFREAILIMMQKSQSALILAQYLELEPIESTLKKVMEILSLMEQKKPPYHDELINWFMKIYDLIDQWNWQLNSNNMDITPADPELLDKITTKKPATEIPGAALQEATMIVLYDNEKMAKVFKQLMEGSMEKILFTSKTDAALKAFKEKKCDLLVSTGTHNSSAYKEKLVLFIQERRETPIVLCGVAPLSLKVKKIYQKAGFEHFHTLTKDSRQNNLFFENVLKSYRKEGSIAFLSSFMIAHLDNIKPLPQTIREIQRLQSDHEASLQELIKIIMQDTPLSIDIIKRANAPINGLRQEVTTVQNAVTLLGKDRTIATALSCNVANTMPIDLSPYGMTMDEFNAVANLRMNLIMHWYQKVSKNDAGFLMTAALMGNIGQLVIALEAARQEKVEEFKSLSEEAGSTFAELELFYTTSEDLTSEILEDWGLNDKIVDALAFCHNLDEAPSEIFPYALALHAVFKIVPQTKATFDADAIDTVCNLLEYHQVNPQPLLDAIVVCEEKYLSQ